MKWAVRIVSWLSSLILTMLHPVFLYLNRVQPPKLPPTKNPLLQLSATELAKKIRLQQVTSEAVVTAYIKRIKKVNPFINAVVDERYEDAVREARDCDKMLESGEVTIDEITMSKPLFGVPFTVKESCGLKGLSQTGCTRVRRGIKAAEDSLIVASMRKAGAIPLCVTNTPELCSGFESANLVYGTTVNPYDGRHSAGGSSGGEGALIGAGASLIGIGSDIAGSIRVPSLFNGIFGHKPTPGIIPIKGHFPMSNGPKFQTYLALGPMTRFAEDLHLAVKVMSADCKQNLRLDDPVDIGKLNVFYMEDAGRAFGITPTNKDTRNAIFKAAQYFEKRGAKVVKPEMDEMSETCEVATGVFFSMKDMPPILIPSNTKDNVNSTLELLKSLVGRSEFTKSAIFMSLVKDLNGLVCPSNVPICLQKLEDLRVKLLKQLGDNGVFLYPTFTCGAPLVGQVVLNTSAGMYCLLCNLLGFPSTQVPMGLDAKGLPIGFQVFAAPHQDRLCLAVAKELEKAFGGWIPPTKS
ncbi:fatty-acid amide hydrolase 2-A [Diachasma alloeum]|uniref:fatty-acid amide hydrolase 2-A n=1 Tax=Diachasma alloeum TaxID=454923 RepID=UPI000738147A|nr:fatty-acid amide hydrolase 2-A [Diachasma alloeum]XP_015117791.1 fatty-acid amide hydrolase 2-A [Diachasma alloeum]